MIPPHHPLRVLFGPAPSVWVGAVRLVAALAMAVVVWGAGGARFWGADAFASRGVDSVEQSFVAAGAPRGASSRSTAPSLSQVPSVNVGYGVAATWEEPRKTAKERSVVGHALPPHVVALLLADTPVRVVRGTSRAARPALVARWRSERGAVPDPRGPPVG
jgi:hypothetical protein